MPKLPLLILYTRLESLLTACVRLNPADTTTMPAINRMLWLANLLRTTLAGMIPENVTSTMVQIDTTANVV